MEKQFAGVNMRVCVCKTHLCNSGGGGGRASGGRGSGGSGSDGRESGGSGSDSRGSEGQGSGGQGQRDEVPGLKCYGVNGTPEQCEGVCATLTALEDGTSENGMRIRKGHTVTTCKPVRDKTGCREIVTKYDRKKVRECLCNTDLCNGGGGGGGGGGRGQGDKGTKGDTQTLSKMEAFFKRPVVIGGIAGGVALIVLICCIVCCCKRAG